jgi:hypothetical protein
MEPMLHDHPMSSIHSILGLSLPQADISRQAHKGCLACGQLYAINSELFEGTLRLKIKGLPCTCDAFASGLKRRSWLMLQARLCDACPAIIVLSQTGLRVG